MFNGRGELAQILVIESERRSGEKSQSPEARRLMAESLALDDFLFTSKNNAF